MAGREIVYSLPTSYLSEDMTEWNKIQLTFVPYAVAAIESLRRASSEIPLDAYVIGDNWAFLLTGTENFKGRKRKRIDDKDEDRVFWNIQLMEHRFDGANQENLLRIEDYLEVIGAEESDGFLDARILGKIAIIDRTSFAFPLFDEERVEFLEETSWGRKIRVTGFSTLIYHIQRELHPKIKVHLK